jgi:hypothetical protein
MQTTIEFPIYHLEYSERKHALHTGLLAAINTCWHAFNKWYERIDEVPAYFSAVLLHPLKRLKRHRKSWTTESWVETGVKRSKEQWKVYKDIYEPTPNDAPAVGGELSLWGQYRRQVDAVPADDDFMVFVNAVLTQSAQGATVLAWWCSSEQRAAYPALSKLAIDVLFAYAMSADSEVIFSGARCCEILLSARIFQWIL